MLSLTTVQLLPLLQLLAQPAFCIRHSDGKVFPNASAATLSPISADDLPVWMGSNAGAYADWDRQDSLSLSLTLSGGSCGAVIQALPDGTLFLLSPSERMLADSTPLAVTAQVLRQPLADLCSLTQGLTEQMEDTEDPVLQAQSCAINRQLYRLSRIACTLADLEHLQSGAYRLRLEKLDLCQFLKNLLLELTDVCSSAGRRMEATLPEKPVFITADGALLERAILQLLSNALKYGRADLPIQFWTELTPTALLLRMRNTCRDTESDLLSAAFRRMEQRNTIPDPQWGLGLGLPLTRSIARLLGGTVAVELSARNEATITMSISRNLSPTDPTVSTPPPFDYTGGMLHSLVELSDSLPDECFFSAAL